MKKHFSYFIVVCLFLPAVFTSCDDESYMGEKDGDNFNFQTISLDKTFGQNGKTIIPNTSEISLLDFDRNGNIIAVGYTIVGSGKTQLTIAKTNADGLLDESFGNDGLTKVTDYDNSMPYGLKITKDNKIIVLGSFTKIQFQGYETIMMRFNEDGTVDENFGDNGKVNLNFNTGYMISLNFENDDFMLIAKQEGETIDNNGVLYYYLTGYSISKYNYEGKLDNSFGKNGIVNLINSIYPYCMKILNNGSIIIAGTYNTKPNTELGLCKLTPHGELDPTFANGGVWHMNVMQDFTGLSDFESFFNILEDNNGNLVLSGSGLTNSLGWGNRAFLSKFSFNGKLDLGFGKGGFYCFDFGGSNKPIFHIGNKYITSGWYNNESHKIIYIDNYGSSGVYAYTCDIYYFQDMKRQGNNKIILGGGYRIDNTYNANFAIERIICE